jgi:glycosyltransferase involved in cell wall biosynthesis
MPKVSVIMPVYNGEKFVQDAINSILNQTFSDFELILINDGSNDSSLQVISSYNDPRIVLINNIVNTGLPNVRNQGLYASRGEYIAWLDSDDISVPERLEKQVEFLDKNPQVGMCGAWIQMLGAGNNSVVQFPSDPEFIRAQMLFSNCFANSTTMMRAACTREINLRFDLSHHLSQDYGLWVRIPRHWKITNIPEVLTTYRLHSSQVTEIYKRKQIELSWEIQKEQLLALGIESTEQDRLIHMSLSGFIPNTFQVYAKLFEAKNYLIKLDKANQKHNCYNQRVFREILLTKWLTASNLNSLPITLMLISYWMMLKFGIINFDTLRHVTKKNAKSILNRLISVFAE